MTDYSTRHWDGGRLYGLRVFKVSHTGSLESLYRKHTWTVGPQLAACLPTSIMFPAATSWGTREPQEIGHHDWLNCQCGFYGQTDGHNPYMPTSCSCVTDGDCGQTDHRKVTGIVEAWGRVIVGDKGFRAEYVAIRALVITARFASVGRNYPTIPSFPTESSALGEFPLTPTTEAAA